MYLGISLQETLCGPSLWSTMILRCGMIWCLNCAESALKETWKHLRTLLAVLLGNVSVINVRRGRRRRRRRRILWKTNDDVNHDQCGYPYRLSKYLRPKTRPSAVPPECKRTSVFHIFGAPSSWHYLFRPLCQILQGLQLRRRVSWTLDSHVLQ